MKSKKSRGGVKRLRYRPVSYDDLKRIESNEPKRTDTPKALHRSAIKIADRVFQHRPYDESIQASEEHVRYLAGELKKGAPLEAVLVTAVGQEFYLVEGHHRMDAYHTVNWKKPIPVEVYVGSVSDARDEAFARNHKDKLPMTQEAKHEAAWRRFLDHELSNAELSRRYSVHRNTVTKMANAEKALLDAKENPSDVRWRDARKHEWSKPDEPFEYEAHVSAKAQKLAEELKKISHFFKDPEITARAIAMVSPGGAQALADHLRDEDEAALEAWDSQLQGEKAPEVLEVDIATAVSLVTGQLHADGQSELARQVDEALQKALKEHADSFKL